VTTNAPGHSGNWQNATSVYGGDNSHIHPDQHALAVPGLFRISLPGGSGNGTTAALFEYKTARRVPAAMSSGQTSYTGLAISEFTGGDMGPNFCQQAVWRLRTQE